MSKKRKETYNVYIETTATKDLTHPLDPLSFTRVLRGSLLLLLRFYVQNPCEILWIHFTKEIGPAKLNIMLLIFYY